MFLLIVILVNVSSGQDCVRFGEGCIKCNNNICQTCNVSSFMKDNYCVSCSVFGFNCLNCDSDRCTSCDGLLENGRCYSCSEIHKNCTSCSELVCKSCLDGYYLDQSKECEKCSLNNCLKCSSANQCTNCEEDYALKDGKCEPKDHCSSGTNDNCYSCGASYYLDNGKCVKCPEGCTECGSPSYCWGCIEGYYYASGKCSKKPDYCNSMGGDGKGVCTGCIEGYNLINSNSDNPCVSVIAGCLNGTKTVCYECLSGFYLTSDRKCSSTETNYECSKTDQNGQCLRCSSGNVFNTNGECKCLLSFI